jgi:hypothetical protein
MEAAAIPLLLSTLRAVRALLSLYCSRVLVVSLANKDTNDQVP